MRSFRLFVALACFLLGLNAVLAVDFEDLKEKQGKVYGSEKEKRYVIDAFFVEWESFPRKTPTHSSFHFFWLYNTADYPKYTRSQFFPFYFSETSKVDERREINHLLISHYSKEANGSYSYKLFPFYWSGVQAHGSSYHSIAPLYYSETNVTDNKKENLILFPGFYKQSSESINKNFQQVTSVSPFHVYNSTISAEGESSQYWFPALPIYYSYVDYRITHRNYFWLIDTEFDLKKDSYSQVWVAPFVFWKKDSYLNIFPFYFFDTSPENKTSSVYGLLPPFYYSYAPEKSVFYLLNYYSDSKVVNSKKENFTTFAPFVFHWNNNKGLSQTIVPLLFYGETNEDKSTYKNILLVYDQSNDSSGNLDRLLIAPFFYYKKNSSLYLAPFYFSNFSKEETQGENFGLVPPFYSSYSPNHKTFYTLNYYSNTKFSKDTSENFTMVAPFYFNSSNNKGYSQTIVPLLFYSETEEDSSTHKNILLSYDHAFDSKGNLEKLFISPIYFYKKDSYFHIAPFYFSFASKDDKSGGWFGVIPPAYYSYSPNHKTFYTLNYYSYSNFTKDLSENFSMFAPFYFSSSNNKGYSQTVVPLLLYSETEEDSSTHKNILLSYDHAFDSKGNLERLFISPIYFYKRDSYFHIAPFYFSFASKDDKSGGWFGVIPPAYYSYSPNHKTFYTLNYYSYSNFTKDLSENFSMFAPFYFSSSNNKGYSQTLIPGLYYSITKEDSSNYKNILLAYSQKTDEKGKLESLFFSPIIFYRKDYFLHIAPLYWSWINNVEDTASNTVEKNYRTLFLPFIYRETNADNSSYTNTLGFVSRERDEKGKLKGSMVFPFYFYKRDSYDIVFPFTFKFGPDEEAKDTGTRFGLMYYNNWNPKEETLWIANWFSYQDKENNTHFKSLNPIYYNWKTKNSSGEVSPLYLTIEFANRDRFHLNFTGYSSNVASGILKPDLSIGIGEKEGYKYIDTDLSWLWYVFKISSRISTVISNECEKSIWQQNCRVTQDKLSEEGRMKQFEVTGKSLSYNLENNPEAFNSNEANPSLSPKISKRKTFTREDSIDFFGVNLLFGLYGWEAGDSKRHIRAFPLAWFTWDTKSDDKVYTVPPLFVNYYSQDLRYRVLFPLYGYQRTPESERTAIALFGYIGESLKENRTEEKSILWPLANWHSSDIKSGSRILPFYWYRNRNEGRDKISDLVTPLFYYNNTLDRKGVEDSYVLSPVWFRFYSRVKDESSDKHFALPFYYFQKSQTRYENKNLFVSLPFIYYGVSDTQSKSLYNRNFWMIPALALYNSDNFITNWNFALLVNSSRTKENNNFLFFPVYYHDIDYDKEKTISLTRWILPAYYKKNYATTDTDTDTVKFYSPLYFYHSYENKSTAQSDNYWFAPIPALYHSYQTKNNESYWNWLAFASYEKSNTAHNIKIYPVFYQDFYTQDSKNFDYTNWFIPFYYWNSTKATRLAIGDEKEISQSKYSFYSLAWIYTNENNANKKWFIPPALTYYSSEKESSKTEAVSFYSPLYFYNSYKNKSTAQNDYNWFTLIPFIYNSYTTENNRTYWNIMALTSYENSNTVNNFKILPLYYHDLNYEKGKLTSVTRWIISGYYNKKFAKDTLDSEQVSFYSPFLLYNSSVNSSKKSEDISWFAPIPVLYHSYKLKDKESYWNLLGLASYEKSISAHTLKIYPIFYQDFYEQDANNFNYTNWFVPLYYWNNNKTTSLVTNETGDKKISQSEFSFYSLFWIYTNQNNTNKKWLIPPALAYHSYEKENNHSYWNVMLLSSYENSNTVNHLQILPLYSHNFQYENKRQTSSIVWAFPVYYEKEFAKTSTDNAKVKFYSPLVFYHSYENKSTAQSDNYWFAPVPLLYHSYKTKNNESYWNWLAITSYEKSNTAHNLKIYPIFYQDFYEQDAKNYNYTNWFAPLYYWNSKKSTSLVASESGDKQITESEFSFYSLFLIYTNQNNKNKNWFIPIALAYHSESREKNYTNWLLFISREKSEEKTAFQVFPIYSQNFENNKKEGIANSTVWLAPLFYLNEEIKKNKEKQESKFSLVTPLGYFKNENNLKKEWFVTGLYHSEAPNTSYYNLLFFLNSENSKERTALNIFPIFGKSTGYNENGKPAESNYWSLALPLWVNKKYATDTNAGETSIASLPMYLNYKYDREDSNNSYLNMWIMPLIFNYTLNKDETSWSWLFLSSYSGNKNRTSMLLLPVSGFDFDKRNIEKDYSSLWILPAFYYKKEENRATEKSEKTFISLLYNEFETENKKDNTFEKSILFPVLPFLFYKNTTQNGEHTKILTLLDYMYKKGTLARLTLFPYWYSLNTDNPDNPVKYRHIFPVYFSKEDKAETTSLVSGLYLNSNLKSSMQNFLMLAEHKHSKESDRREVDFLFRSIHLAKAKEEVNVRLLYGLGNYSSTPEEKDMNLLWIASKNKKEYAQNNILPLYYSEEKKSEKQMWVAPALYYSKSSDTKQFKHAALGTLYYEDSDKVKQEEHVNLLMGILYYKTSLAKERGYTGQGSLWGLLWEYKTESETKYSKFAVMKFVYSKTTDETGESYQRILGVRL